MTNWLEVSLSVDGELAEAVAEVLARFAPNGVVTEQGVRYENDEDPGTATGPILVRAYLAMDDRLEQTRRNLEESLYYLGRIRPLPAPTFKPIAEQNWMEAWKQHYRPIPIGEGLMIVPAWITPSDPLRTAIRIEPGMAFGTGTHPSTQLCLELMEPFYPAHPGSNVIDVGCGSGILCIAALKLGARNALGVDIDPEAIQNARENARINGIGKELFLGLGSVAEIRQGKFPIRQAPLVVANILAPVILRLLESGLTELVELQGILLLSGIMEGQSQAVLEAAQARGLTFQKSQSRGEWVALALSH